MEAQQGFPFKPQPMTLVAYEIDCASIADCNDENLLANMGCSTHDLACAWENMATKQVEPPPWVLADKFLTLGIAGIVVRSFASACTSKNQNLILWNWSDSTPHSARVIDD